MLREQLIQFGFLLCGRRRNLAAVNNAVPDGFHQIKLIFNRQLSYLLQ